MMGNKKLQVWLPLLFSLVLIAGMFLGYQLGSRGNSHFFSSGRSSSLQEVLDLIRLKYVDSVDLDSLEGKAIQEMMSELDPHSVYLPPVKLQEANEDLAGNFQGIGVEFSIFNDTVNVVYVIPGGPSEKAGLKTGDRIIRANDSLIAGRNMNAESVKQFIRGPGGSRAVLQILREQKPMTITVTRGTIPVPSVDAAYMLDKTTGYIKLNKFTEKAYEEFMKALEDLKKQGLQSLIFDLRGNGGGFMNEAVDIADEFLDGDKLVVYMQGAKTKKTEYRCKRPGLFEKGKLMLLVDELSASASEVLAGALQDWCRAEVIGRRTFGKGLVQQQYPLSDGSAIRLTIARYYTPIGRSIQRSYAKGHKVYMDELWERYNSGEMFSSDSVLQHHNGKMYYSVCRDTLYGGDGITPDIFVPLDTTLYKTRFGRWLDGEKINRFLYNYYVQHITEMSRYTSAADYNQRFQAAPLWDSLLQATRNDSQGPQQLSPAEQAGLQLRMKALLARYKWRDSGYFQVINQEDPVIRRALSALK